MTEENELTHDEVPEGSAILQNGDVIGPEGNCIGQVDLCGFTDVGELSDGERGNSEGKATEDK